MKSGQVMMGKHHKTTVISRQSTSGHQHHPTLFLTDDEQLSTTSNVPVDTSSVNIGQAKLMPLMSQAMNAIVQTISHRSINSSRHSHSMLVTNASSSDHFDLTSASTSLDSESEGSGSDSPTILDSHHPHLTLHANHSSPSSSLDSDLGSDNPDEHELLLRRNPGSGGLFDESLLRQVNLAAAFHDHMSCTKLSGEVIKSISASTSILPSSSTSSPLHPSTTFLHSSSIDHNCMCPSFSEEREQVVLLQDMLVTHLELIEYQKEQLQKKDRQLFGLKQDRASLLMRIDKMDKRINFLTKKLLAVAESKGLTSTSTFPTTDVTNSPPKAKMVDAQVQVDPSSFKKKNKRPKPPSQEQQEVTKAAVSSTPTVLPSSPSKSKKSRTISSGGEGLEPPAKKKSRSLSTSCVPPSVPAASLSDDSQGADSLPSSSASSAVVSYAVMKDFLDTETPYDIVSMWEEEENSCSSSQHQPSNNKTRRNSKIKSILPALSVPTTLETTTNISCDTKLSTLSQIITPLKKEASSSAELVNLPTSKPLEVNIEVPSWRILPIHSTDQVEGIEPMDDDTFNRRHSKFEVDERRRKRWDIQRLREQKHNEKLKQGRYYSSSAFIHPDKTSSTSSSASVPFSPSLVHDLRGDTEVISFFPDPMEAEVIEIADKLPVMAFGHPIPRRPHSFLTLPWKNSQSPSGNKKQPHHHSPMKRSS